MHGTGGAFGPGTLGKVGGVPRVPEGGVPGSGGGIPACTEAYSPLSDSDRMTKQVTRENITLPQTSFASPPLTAMYFMDVGAIILHLL